MSLYDKIEEIRRKPEHIRIRYVWCMVCMSMVCIISLWWFSLKSKQIEDASVLNELRSSEAALQLEEQKSTIENTINQTKNVLDTQVKM